MTKAKARQRAKAKAAQKSGKRQEPGADRPGEKIRPGQFNPGDTSIKSPRLNANTKNFGGVKRGAARSR